MAAAFFSLPKQFVTVYLGVALEQSDDGKSNKLDNILKYVVIVVTGIVTFLAMYYINRLMNGVKPAVIYDRRKARQAKLPSAGASSGPYGNSNVFKPATSGAFNPNASDSDMPLTANFNESSYQQWDSNGRAVGYAPDPMLYAPQPQRPRVPQSASRAGSNAPTPVMSEYNGSRGPPSRQNTSGSAASWDVQTHAGGADAYQMSRASPYTDPYSNSTRVPPPQIQQMPYSQSPPPIHSVAPTSATAPVTPRIPPPEQTPTQMQFASYRPPAGLPPGAAQPYQPHSPHSPLPNPYSRGQESSDDPYVAYTSGR
ncbi:hypothetical protein PHLCEN_2v1946 [Hermanssonia centrifuga]|uniref:Uncharacterized protein n=1 Tax=Hermanssonia centrifuga TaxID=98765 RepID=A0A2R6RVI1_9APHY|nr:hypothetical protein PHLCEN_2v1946 [Hermanssonia centrifuga]